MMKNLYERESNIQHLVYICVAVAVGLALLALNSLGILSPMWNFLTS